MGLEQECDDYGEGKQYSGQVYAIDIPADTPAAAVTSCGRCGTAGAPRIQATRSLLVALSGLLNIRIATTLYISTYPVTPGNRSRGVPAVKPPRLRQVFNRSGGCEVTPTDRFTNHTRCRMSNYGSRSRLDTTSQLRRSIELMVYITYGLIQPFHTVTIRDSIQPQVMIYRFGAGHKRSAQLTASASTPAYVHPCHP